MDGASCAVPFTWSAWFYYAGFLLTTIISWVLRDYGGDALDFGPADGCSQDGTCGDLAVLRISFGSVIFFAALMLLTIGITTEENVRMPIHTAFWPIKYLLWGGIIASCFAMPNDVFDVYMQIARVLSVFFIIIQLIILLDFIYRMNEYLLEREQCAFALISLTALLICGSIVGMGFLYKYYAPNSSCSLNIFFITWTFIMFLVYGAISVSPSRNESAGLMTSAAVFAYCMYYTWSALNSEPAGECTSFSTGGSKVIQIIGFVLAIFAVGISTVNAGRSSGLLGGEREEGDLPYRPDAFYFIFLTASAYLVMIYTGWEGPGENQVDEFQVDNGWGATWVKVASSWLCALLYIWSMVAHLVLTNRSF